MSADNPVPVNPQVQRLREAAEGRVIATCEYANGTWWLLDDDDPYVQAEAALRDALEVALRERDAWKETADVLGDKEAMADLLRSAEAERDEARQALQRIAETARWYADNAARLPLEVDHALCVEILSVAEDAVAGVSAGSEGAQE